METGSPTFCSAHNYGRMFCGCPYIAPPIHLPRVEFRVCLDVTRSDLQMQLREAFDMPPAVSLEVYARNIGPNKVIAVDRDAWVRLVATRYITVAATPSRIREWRRALAELGGAA